MREWLGDWMKVEEGKYIIPDVHISCRPINGVALPPIEAQIGRIYSHIVSLYSYLLRIPIFVALYVEAVLQSYLKAIL